MKNYRLPDPPADDYGSTDDGGGVPPDPTHPKPPVEP